MSKYPCLSHEVKINKINFSCINYNDNKQYCYVNYEKNESLYLQTPSLKFIEPVAKTHSNGKTYNEIYLFLTPQDQTTYSFIELINSLENKASSFINSQINKQLHIVNVIKSSELEDDDQENNNQVIKYLKVKLLDQTKIEYNNERITIGDLNKLVSKVNLKLIFEINMIWFNSTKIGLYLKPIKIRAIDIVPEVDFEFRDDNNIESPNDYAQTEHDNIRQILNNQSLMSLNESIFNQQKQHNQSNTKHNQHNQHKQHDQSNTKQTSLFTADNIPNINTESIQLNAFIPSSGIDDHPDLQNQLKNQLFVMNNIKQKTSSKESTKKSDKSNRSNKSNKSDKSNQSDKSNKSDNDVESESIVDSDEVSENNETQISDESSSSIQLKEYCRKKTSKNKSPEQITYQTVQQTIQAPKKRGRPKKDAQESIIVDIKSQGKNGSTGTAHLKQSKANKQKDNISDRQKSIEKLKKLLSKESNSDNDTDSLELDLDLDLDLNQLNDSDE
jgi:hypothetical protein